MRISESNYVKNRVTSLIVEAEKGEDLSDLKRALESHKWFRQNEHGELETAPAHRDPPILFDKDIDPIWDGKPAKLRQLRESKKEEVCEYNNRSIYIQSIGGYDGLRWKKAPKLILAGFEPLRSKRSRKDGKCWEIWYLCGAWAAKGELEGKTEKEILDWIRREIRPGNVELSGEAWGLCAPE